MRAHLHLDGVGRHEPVRPSQGIGGPIYVFLRTVGTMADLPEHPAGDMALEVHPIHAGPGSLKGHTSGGSVCHWNAEFMEFFFENSFETSGAWCKKTVFCAIHHSRHSSLVQGSLKTNDFL